MPCFAPICPVSVVIPTLNRPKMATAAVMSVLAQTNPPREIIVVVDGPEEISTGRHSTAAALAALKLTPGSPTSLRVIALPASVGGAEARNIGARAASADWIAFLDDDDLWLPEKLEIQLAFAALLPPEMTPVLSCPVLARSPVADEVWPRQPYVSRESMSEYLFCRRGFRYGAALLQTSTLLAPRALLQRLPFAAGLRKHQDWDWLLRVAADPAVSIHCVGKVPLVVFHVEGNRASVGRTKDWRFSFAWALERRQYFTPRALLGFLVTECAAQAQAESLRSRLSLLCAVLLQGFPTSGQWVHLLVFLMVPQGTRRFLRDTLYAGKQGVLPL